MIKIDSDKTIHLTRGDATNSINVLPVSIDNYTFQDGDTLSLVVFKKKGYTQTPVLTKTYEISESAESYNLTLTSTDTSKFELTNKKIKQYEKAASDAYKLNRHPITIIWVENHTDNMNNKSI